MGFSTNVRELIEERGLTQRRVAADLHIPVSTLGGYVQGTSEPDFHTLMMFADYFNTSTDYLLGHISPRSNSLKEDAVLRVFRSLTAEEQALYLEQGKAFIKLKSGKRAVRVRASFAGDSAV